MDVMDAAKKAANLEHYAKTIAPETDVMVKVRVVVPPGLWWGPTPRLHKLWAEGEELMVPENVFKNSDYHNPKKSVNGVIVRGVLELADRVAPVAPDGYSDDVQALQEQNRELQRQLAALTGQAPPPVLVTGADVPAKRGPGRPKKNEEI